MSLCINPHCSKPQNQDNQLFCLSCGSELLLQGRYRVLSRLGGGGFGVTFESNDVRTSTPKVLKVLINNQQKAIELFQQEAQVLSQLNHPGIPKVERDGYFIYFPKNSQNAIHCLIMEKIVGHDLEKYMQNRGMRPIDQTLAIEWLREIVNILKQVHSQNFFHRDIKPPNIMLRADGRLALIDFGTAREVTQTYFMAQAQARVTQIVSAGYTPIEQMNFQAVLQSDFFALGRTFIYLLTGKDPLASDIYNPQDDQLRWRNYAPQISANFADLIDQMMARLPSQRPQSTEIILQRLIQIERDLNAPIPIPTPTPIPIPTPIPTSIPAPIPPSRRKFIKLLGFGVVGVGLAGLIYAIFPKSKSKLIVSRLGDGDYTSISEAIKNANVGTSILIRPGTYQEGLIINKQLKIIGDGTKAEIIIESKDSNCILMQTEYAEVSGLTLRCQAGQSNKKYFGVDISQGQLVLENCDITSDSLSCVGIYGATANPIIRSCQIHDGKEGGILIRQNAKATVQNCEIFANGLPGIEIREEANPNIQGCKMHNGKQVGILVQQNGKGTVQDCDIFANELSGIEIRKDANPIIQACKIRDGKQAGILVQQNGKGTIENCDIFGNQFSGVEIRNAASPVIRNCKINRNNQYAMYIHDNAGGTIENCDLTGNIRGVFDIDSTSQVQRSGNKESESATKTP